MTFDLMGQKPEIDWIRAAVCSGNDLNRESLASVGSSLARTVEVILHFQKCTLCMTDVAPALSSRIFSSYKSHRLAKIVTSAYDGNLPDYLSK